MELILLESKKLAPFLELEVEAARLDGDIGSV